MRRLSTACMLACCFLAAPRVWAEDAPIAFDKPDSEMLSTKHEDGHDDSASPRMPWVKTDPSAKPATGADTAPQAAPSAPAPATPTAPAPSPFSSPQGKIPFGHAEPTGPVVPSAPHTSVAVPVPNVDAVEVREPTPAAPLPPESDPSAEDPANPTELTSPIFEAETSPTAPRKVILRALNKVTAQSALLTLRPGETAQFGQLFIKAMTCRVSTPTSQTDYAGLFDVAERISSKEGLKPIFRGWMYASSPSIAGLEHPVYDLTMVACNLESPTAKPDKPADPKADKKSKH